MNAADIVCGGIWLVILTSVAHRLLKGVLPDFFDTDENSGHTEENLNLGNPAKRQPESYCADAGHCGCFAGCLFWGIRRRQSDCFSDADADHVWHRCCFLPAVKRWIGVYETGEYFLSMFCVALGLLQADFSQVLEKGAGILIFTAIALPLSSILFHLLLSRIFRIDRDTFLISSTAGVRPGFYRPGRQRHPQPANDFSGHCVWIIGVCDRKLPRHRACVWSERAIS